MRAQVGLTDAAGESASELAVRCGVPKIAGMLRLAQAAQADQQRRAEALQQARLAAEAGQQQR
jgi:hypothetical protein